MATGGGGWRRVRGKNAFKFPILDDGRPVPEKHRVEPQILTGEIPNPTAIPAGCRFHPRCPLVASGQAAALGVVDRCTGVAVELVDHGAGHLAACHALGA